MRGLKFFIPLALFTLIALNGCNGCTEVDQSLKKSVAFQYDHVANVKRVHFTKTVEGVAGNFVEPVNQGGFWAIFVICSLDVQGSDLKTFNYNAGNFFVENGNTNYGAMQPFQVRYGASTMLNSPADTPKIIAAVANETQLGPTTQIFPHQFFPSLNDRVAVFIPDHPAGYGGGQLTLRYAGQPSFVVGRGQQPAQVFAVGGFQPASLPATCRPPIAH